MISLSRLVNLILFTAVTLTSVRAEFIIDGIPTVCLTNFCIVDASVSGFSVVSEQLSGDNNIVDTTATFSGEVFAAGGDNPVGGLLGLVSILGTADFEFFGRTSSTQLGIFDAQLTSADFLGALNSMPFEVTLNPGAASDGVTSISAVANSPRPVLHHQLLRYFRASKC